MFQVTKNNGAGYKLFDKGNGLWQIQTPTGIFTGNLKQVCTYAVMKLDFTMEELEIGIMEMEKQFHDGAEYGIFKRFMYTFDTQEKPLKTGSN